MHRTEFFVISDHFLPFYPTNNPKNQNFEKMKKALGDIIILHRCNTNDNHIMYSSSDTRQDRQHLLSFWTIYCPFTSLTTGKIKILKKWHFTHMYHKWQSYDVWFLRYGACQTQFFVILDPFLPFYSPNNPKNQNFEKNEKNTWKYYHFTHVYHKWQSYDAWFLRYRAQQTEVFVILEHFLLFYFPNNSKN